MHVERHDLPPAPELLELAGDVYTRAFDRPPYTEGPDSADGFYDRAARYAARPGFRLTLCRSEAGLVGLALSVHAYPGDWWRDRCAEALGPQRAAEWLAAPVREVVHVAVSPTSQRQGAGRLMTEDALDDPAVTSVVLSCHPEARPAQALYLSCGFHRLTEQFRTAPDQASSWLMARRPRQR